jgi:(E)-4-hydroxy-3-methylbut-2-enyl-diphosphate synthase
VSSTGRASPKPRISASRCPARASRPIAPVFVDGQHTTTLRGTYDELAAQFQQLIDDYVDRKYPHAAAR